MRFRLTIANIDQSLRTSNTIANTMGSELGHSSASTNNSPISDVVALQAMNQPGNEGVQNTIPESTPPVGSTSPKRKIQEDESVDIPFFQSKKPKFEDDVGRHNNGLMAQPRIVKNFKGLTINTGSEVRSSGKRRHGDAFVDKLASLMKKCKIEDDRPTVVRRKTQKSSWASMDDQGWDHKTGLLQGDWTSEDVLRR